MLYDSPSLKLLDDRFVDELGEIRIEDIPDRHPVCEARLTDPTPLMEKLWRCALFDVEANRCTRSEGRYLAAGGRGKGWNGMVFTRDIGYAGILGLNRIFPRDMRENLETTRRIRLSIGLTVDRDHYLPGLPFRKEDISGDEFKEKYGTNPYARRTDDVLWLWWADDLFAEHYDTLEDWLWLYETGQRCFAELYDPFFDQDEGLYCGQSSFVDIALNGYPESFSRHSLEAKRNCLKIKAGSTNCLYYKGLTVMARAARTLGKDEEAEQWGARAAQLKRAIRTRMLHPDGTFAYFRHADKHLEQRQHCLGTAFAILCGILDDEEAKQAIENYPVTWWGVPLFHPFYPNGECYHNNSAWPFCDAFFLRARQKALGVDETGRQLALLAKSCRGDTFHEWTSALCKSALGKPAQLWTLGSFIGCCVNAGYLSHGA